MIDTLENFRVGATVTIRGLWDRFVIPMMPHPHIHHFQRVITQDFRQSNWPRQPGDPRGHPIPVRPQQPAIWHCDGCGRDFGVDYLYAMLNQGVKFGIERCPCIRGRFDLARDSLANDYGWPYCIKDREGRGRCMT